jgi:tRNA dimethylallyltransferase
MNKTLITLSGPTASGKTTLSIRIAKVLGAEIFSCDSRQFYKEMSIGTSVPSESERKEVVHHFIQHKSIQSTYSVGHFEEDAMDALMQYFADHDVAILVGGSGLYMQAVVEGVDKFPEVPEEIRTEIGKRMENNGLEDLQNELKTLDPDHYQKMDIQNPSRVLRALGVSLAAGKPYSSFFGQDKPKRPFSLLPLTIDISRKILYDRINDRVDEMIYTGLLKEAKSLYPYRDLNALQTVGYQEVFDYFDKKIDLDATIALIKQHTRHYAKRQMTWIRRKESNAVQIKPTIPDEELVSILSKYP